MRSATDALKRGQWELARQILAPLAEGENADAQYALGTLYANGDGVAPNMARAEQLWRQAAQKGHPRAREQLAFLRATNAAPATTAAAANPVGGLEQWRVQIATVPSPESAQREFRRLARQYGEILAGTDLVAPLFTLPDGGQVVRVQAGPVSEERARDICAKLRDLNAGCRVIRPEG
ncbi:MAG: SPOR domain-containing protein [Telmatospirillum sp.]|nr:SPOR domain-containing protein [Telmatospirillum sp.]